MKYRKLLLAAILVLIFAGISYSAPFTQAFRNDFQTDSIFLFITKGIVEFDKWQQVPKDWEVGYDQADMLSISGPMVDPGEKFRVKFSDRGTFTLEWAEFLDGVLIGSGSLFAVDGNFVGANNSFASQAQIPTPITGTMWLLGSGIVFLFCARRKLTN